MTQIVQSIELAVDAATAFGYWMDIESFPTFMETVTNVTVSDVDRSYWEIRLGGIDWEYDAVITSIIPGDRLDWKSTSGELELVGSTRFEALDDRHCRLTVKIVWAPHSFVEHVGALLGDDARAVARELDNFGAYVSRKTGAPRAVAD